MQPHQYALAAGVALLITLIALPYLFAIARKRAFDRGHAAGLAERNSTHRHHIESLIQSATTTAMLHHEELRTHLKRAFLLQETVAELEARILAYTGLAVSQADRQLLTTAAETLAVAGRTWNQMPGTEPWRERAKVGANGLTAFAARVNAELRASPSAEKTQGEAA